MTDEEKCPEKEDTTEKEKTEGEPKKHPKDGGKEKRELAVARKELEELQKKLDEKNDQYVRLYAEYDNFRKRSQKEKDNLYTESERDNIYNDAYADALKALFPVVDNLTRAAQYTGGEEVAKGVAMTLQSVNDTLAKLGVVPVGKVGETFDPNLHNAVLHVEDETKGEGEIVEVLQAGYKRGDRVLRYAMVKVAN